MVINVSLYVVRDDSACKRRSTSTCLLAPGQGQISKLFFLSGLLISALSLVRGGWVGEFNHAYNLKFVPKTSNLRADGKRKSTIPKTIFNLYGHSDNQGSTLSLDNYQSCRCNTFILSCMSNMDYIAVEPAAAAWSDQALLGIWTCMVFGISVAYSDYLQESACDPSHQSPYVLLQTHSAEYSSTEHDDPSPPKNYMDSSTMPVTRGGIDRHSRGR